MYCDVENTEFLTPAIITGDSERPDIVVIKDKECKVLELTVGFETNILKNSERKKKKYTDLIRRLNKDYDVEYVDLSMGGIGVIGSESIGIQKMFVELGLSSKESDYLVRKVINVCIRSTYYIFCQQNKQWEGPSLLAW